MIFDNSRYVFESEKERNFYYKIFAGYIFNELIPGYQNRLERFCNLLTRPEEKGMGYDKRSINLNPSSTHISFDNHLYLFSQLKTDKGEFADILIHDKNNNVIIAIEAKLHSAWSYEKDIVSNTSRHDLIRNALPSVIIKPVLLLLKYRWDYTKKQESKDHSNYLRFKNDKECKFIVILWEQIRDLIDDEKVMGYFEAQVNRVNLGVGYSFEENWFIQK